MTVNSAAVRSAALRRNRTSNAIRSHRTHEVARQAVVAQRARQEAARQAAVKEAARQAAAKEAARQAAARREAAKRETTRRLKQIADQRRTAELRSKQNAIREKAQHAKRVADGRAIPTRVKQVVNYGLGRKTIESHTVQQINVMNSRLPKTQPNIVNHSSIQGTSAQPNKTATSQLQKGIAQSKATNTKPLTAKEKAAALMKKYQEPPKIPAKEKARVIMEKYEKAERKAERKAEKAEAKKLAHKAEIKKIVAGWKAEEAAAKKAITQKAATTKTATQKSKTTKIVRNTTTKSTKIATRSSSHIKASVDAHKENVSKSKAKDKQVSERRKAAAEKDSQRNKSTTRRVTRNATIAEKQAQPKVGGTTTAILHSFQNSVKAGSKGPVTRRSQRIAQQSGAHGDDDGYGSDGGYSSDGSGSDSDDDQDIRLNRKVDTGNYTQIAKAVSKQEARKIIRDGNFEIPEAQKKQMLDCLKKGTMQRVNIKISSIGVVRISCERSGQVDGFQRMSFEINACGEKTKVVQTAFDKNNKLVRQRPGANKNNLFDIKKHGAKKCNQMT